MKVAVERLVLHVTLRNIRPPIWRRIAVAEDLTLAQLHRVIQEAFGWEDYHLHEFEIGSTKFGRPHHDEGGFGSESPMRDERKCKLGSAMGAHRTFTYWYDFGDDWFHDVVVERRESMAAGAPRAELLAGEHASPPEDCGGPYGYAELLEALRDHNHPEHAEIREWAGDFDPGSFDLDAAKRRVAAVTRARSPRAKVRGKGIS
jgi:hypothetical protein